MTVEVDRCFMVCQHIHVSRGSTLGWPKSHASLCPLNLFVDYIRPNIWNCFGFTVNNCEVVGDRHFPALFAFKWAHCWSPGVRGPLKKSAEFTVVTSSTGGRTSQSETGDLCFYDSCLQSSKDSPDGCFGKEDSESCHSKNIRPPLKTMTIIVFTMSMLIFQKMYRYIVIIKLISRENQGQYRCAISRWPDNRSRCINHYLQTKQYSWVPAVLDYIDRSTCAMYVPMKTMDPIQLLVL